MNFPFNNRGWFLPAITTAASFLAKKKENPFIEAGRSLLGSTASGVGSAVGGALGGKLTDKITGIPSALSATEQGLQAAEYMNAAYPGTTPWDRLGAGGGGSPSALSASNVERMKMRQENKMQSRALSTQALIADRQNRAHLISTASGYGIPGIREVLKAYDGSRTTSYDTPSIQAREKLPYELQKLSAEKAKILMDETASYQQALKIAAEGDTARVHAEFARKAAELGLSESQSRVWLNWANTAKSVVNSGTDIFKTGRVPKGSSETIEKFDKFGKSRGSQTRETRYQFSPIH